MRAGTHHLNARLMTLVLVRVCVCAYLLDPSRVPDDSLFMDFFDTEPCGGSDTMKLSDSESDTSAFRRDVSPGTRRAHLARSTESFTKPLLFAAAKTHECAHLYQKLFKEKMLEIDSEMRARGFMQLMVHRGTGITEMPHASSGTRSKSNKRTAAAYEGHRLRKRNRAGEERSSDSFSANVSNSSGVRRVREKSPAARQPCCLGCGVLVRR